MIIEADSLVVKGRVMSAVIPFLKTQPLLSQPVITILFKSTVALDPTNVEECSNK